MNRHTKMFVNRGLAATAFMVVVAALLPAIAAGGVPRASWYWSMIVPRSSPNVLLLATSNGLYRSSTGGRSWKPTGPSGVNQTSVVQTGSAILVAGLVEAPGASPTVDMRDGSVLVAPGRSVVATSTDGGITWQDVHPKGLPTVGVQALAVDPANDRVVYAVLRNAAVYRSTDGALSFEPVSARIGGTPWALAVVAGGHLVAGDMTTGSYLSANAARWRRTAFVDPDGGRMVMEYATQPGKLDDVVMTSYGIVLSADGGKSWHVVLKSKVMFGPVAWSPEQPDSAYAVGWDRSLWHSTDGGESWARSS